VLDDGRRIIAPDGHAAFRLHFRRTLASSGR
jgi:hypothetical protein